MQNFENLYVFEILITQKLLKCPKDPFLRSALIYFYGDSQDERKVIEYSGVRSILPDYSLFYHFIHYGLNCFAIL